MGRFEGSVVLQGDGDDRWRFQRFMDHASGRAVDMLRTDSASVESLGFPAVPAGTEVRVALAVGDPFRHDPPLAPGDPVRKRRGYKFPGVIRIAAPLPNGEMRYLVERDDSDGQLHVFSERDIVRVEGQP